jgi:hypothetical protein
VFGGSIAMATSCFPQSLAPDTAMPMTGLANAPRAGHVAHDITMRGGTVRIALLRPGFAGHGLEKP